MPAMETGDLIFMDNMLFGHFGMAISTTHFVHANDRFNLHISSNDSYDPKLTVQKPAVSMDPRNRIFRPPWGNLSLQAEARKAELVRVAQAMIPGAKYGAYRAVRVFLGAGGFGPDAYTRFMKYRQRYEANKGSPANFAIAGNEVVKTVTCTEAVMIMYQLTFPLQERPFFMNLDAAHTMPRDLRDWFRPNGWEEVRD